MKALKLIGQVVVAVAVVFVIYVLNAGHSPL